MGVKSLKNLDFGKIFENISNIVNFSKNFDFSKISNMAKFSKISNSKNFDFGQIFEKYRFWSKLTKILIFWIIWKISNIVKFSKNFEFRKISTSVKFSKKFDFGKKLRIILIFSKISKNF